MKLSGTANLCVLPPCWPLPPPPLLPVMLLRGESPMTNRLEALSREKERDRFVEEGAPGVGEDAGARAVATPCSSSTPSNFSLERREGSRERWEGGRRRRKRRGWKRLGRTSSSQAISKTEGPDATPPRSFSWPQTTWNGEAHPCTSFARPRRARRGGEGPHPRCGG